jgi:thymidylate synthase (FAD)
MGNDYSIVQAARVSYGKDEQDTPYIPGSVPSLPEKDRQLIRYMLNHGHTTPFEMVEFKFRVEVPMDCWRQWIRHRTANVNEYSTRYSEAMDHAQQTGQYEWRLQSKDNKQGSSGVLDGPIGSHLTPEEAADLLQFTEVYRSYDKAGWILTNEESFFHKAARRLYALRLKLGIAKEVARKDLPLSTYTQAYWKCDLHNIFGFLRQRMDSHAQLEIRSYANAMANIVKQVVPVAWEAFEDYILYAKRFSRMEMELLKQLVGVTTSKLGEVVYKDLSVDQVGKPDNMTDREWKEFLAKLS